MYRVCFAGDSVFVIREIEPEAQVAPIWASFCGHMFAVAGLIHEMDQAIGNPGLFPLRLFLSGASGGSFEDRWSSGGPAEETVLDHLPWAAMFPGRQERLGTRRLTSRLSPSLPSSV